MAIEAEILVAEERHTLNEIVLCNLAHYANRAGTQKLYHPVQNLYLVKLRECFIEEKTVYE